MKTIKTKAKFNAALKGQTIKDLSVAADDTSVEITLTSGDIFTITGEIIPILVVSPKLKMELIQK